MTRRTLVTGAAGFLGSHLCEALLAREHEVIAVDSLSTGRAGNVAHLLGHPAFKLLRYDVTNFLHVDGPLDDVLHFASPASPRDYLEMPIHTLKVGALGTHKALGLAKAKEARFLLASTSEVYGDPLEHPQREDYWGNVNPIGVRGVYDEAKRFAEAMAMAYYRAHDVRTRIARIFNTYGPRMRIRDGRALPNFITQALRGEPITVYGDGSQTRSLCYVDDLVRGILSLLDSDTPNPVNIGNPDEVTMIDLAREVIEATGSKSEISLKPLPEDDPKVRKPDISRAREVLDWEPQILRSEGLRLTIDYFREALSSESSGGEPA